MDNCGNILNGFLFGKLFENIFLLNTHEVQNLKGELSKDHAECEECANDCNANLGEPRCLELIGYVEYVNENDECQEQQNNKNDANNNPYGCACGSSVLDDSNHYVFGHLFPTNDLCTFGEFSSYCFFFATVCYTVYDPRGGVLNSRDESVNIILELSFVEAFGLGVTIGQLERTVISALNIVENEVSRSACQSGNVGCVQNRTCRNVNSNVQIVNGNSGVFNRNVKIGGESTNGNFGTCNLLNQFAVSVKELNLCGVTGLVGNGNLDTVVGVFNSYVITCVNVVVFVSKYAYEFNNTSVEESSLDESCVICVFDVIGKGLTVCGPNISGLNCFNIAIELCKYVFAQLVQLIGATNVCLACELNGDLGLFFVYTEEINGIAIEFVCEVSSAEPRPTVCCEIAGRIESENVINNICFICGVLVFANFVTIYIIVNVIVLDSFCNVLNGNCVAGHCKGVGALCGENETCALKYSIYILVSCQVNNVKSYRDFCAFFEVNAVNGCVVGFVQCSDNLIDSNVVNVNLIVFDSEQILVNKGEVGEVLCYESNTFCTGSSYFNVSYTVCVNNSLLGIGNFNACERNSDNNARICTEGVVALSYVVKVKVEVVSLSGLEIKACINANALGSVVETNSFFSCCIANKLVQHCSVQNYVVLAYVGSKNHAKVVCNEIAQQCNGQIETNLIQTFSIPVFINSNCVELVFFISVNVNVYTLNAYLGFFGSGLFGSGNFRSGNFGSGFLGLGYFGFGYFGFFGSGFYCLEGSLNGDVLCGHGVNDCIGSNVAPAFKVSKTVVVVNHFGQLNARGKECCDNNVVVFINKGCAVNVRYVNSYSYAGGNNRIISEYHVHDIVDFCSDHILASCYCRNASCCYVESCHQLVADDCLYVVGNFLVEQYELSIACVEVHDGEISKLLTDLACKHTVSNTNSIALNKVVNECYVFYLINSCGVEVCKRIGGSRCLLEQILHIEIVACYFAKLINNVVNGVIVVTVNLCGQTVGDFLAGNVFEFFYKHFKCRNGCEGVNEVLCFEVIREVIAGISFNKGKKNLCITGCENSVVCLAKEFGIYCFENSDDLVHGQAFCKCDEIIGILSVDCENLILDGVCQSTVRITKLVEGITENACNLIGNVNVYNQLAFSKTDITDLIKYVGNLCCSAADEICAGCKSKVEGDFLCYDFSICCIAFVVGDCNACAEQLAALVNVCEFLNGGQHVFKSLKEFLRIQLDCIGISVLNSNCIAVDLDFGNGGCNGVVNTDESKEICFEIELIKKSLSNAGFVENYCNLLVINSSKEFANVLSIESLNVRFNLFNVNNLSIVAALNDVESEISNSLNTQVFCISLCIAYNVYVFYKCYVTAKGFYNRINAEVFIFKNDVKDISVVNIFFQAIENIVCRKLAIVNACGDLFFDNVKVSNIIIGVTSFEKVIDESINRNDVVVYEIVEANDCVCRIEQSFCIEYVCADQIAKILEERSFAKDHCVNVKNILLQEICVQISKDTVCEHSINIKGCAVEVYNQIYAVKCTCIVSASNNRLCLSKVNNVTFELFGNTCTLKHSGERIIVNLIKDLVQELSVICLLLVNKCCQSILINVLVSKSYVADFGFDIIELSSAYKVDASQTIDSGVNVYEIDQNFGGKFQCQIHQNIGLVIDQLISVEIINSLFDIFVVDVTHNNFDSAILNVGLQIHTLEDGDESLLIYTVKQFMDIEAVNQLFYVDISDDRLSKSNDLFLGDNCQNFFFGQDITETATGRDAFKQTLNVTVLQVSKKCLRINGNGNVGRRYVSNRCLVCVYAQPIVSKRTDRQKSQNSYEC